jgi:hypothetical protein
MAAPRTGELGNRLSPTEKKRRGRPPGSTNKDTDRKRWIITEEARLMQPATARQIFYRCVALHGQDFPKTEDTYDLVTRELANLREKDKVPWEWIVDNGRHSQIREMYGSPTEGLQELARNYALNPWKDKGCYVQVWCEKEGLVNVLWEVCCDKRVPIYPTSGYSSVTFAHEAAEAMDRDKTGYLFYVGDFDPSGIDIDRNVEAKLRQYAPDAEFEFERVAITPEQIPDLMFACRPTKAKDTRAKGAAWIEASQITGGQSIEVEAIDPNTLRDTVRKAVENIAESVGIDYPATENLEDRQSQRLRMLANGLSTLLENE